MPHTIFELPDIAAVALLDPQLCNIREIRIVGPSHPVEQLVKLYMCQQCTIGPSEETWHWRAGCDDPEGRLLPVNT